jgi:hypothetical protein
MLLLVVRAVQERRRLEALVPAVEAISRLGTQVSASSTVQTFSAAARPLWPERQ